MPTSKEKLGQRFASLTVREQRMVVGTALLLLWGIWDNFYYQPAQQAKQSLDNEIIQFDRQISTLKQLAQELENSSSSDPNSKNRQSLSSLEQSIDHLKQQLSSGEKSFVPSNLMSSALRDMLKQYDNLKLIKLETLPPKGFGSEGKELSWLYRHTLILTLQGDYFSTLNYLKALEALPWRIHWDHIDYQVKNYPIAETRIQIYTLSFEQDWLSV
jgi:MSHA biogenesis protein MshJ